MNEKYHSLSVRFPVGLWEKIKKYQEGRPHFPLNAIIVEAVRLYFEKPKKAEK
jgi:hypothetical protein